MREVKASFSIAQHHLLNNKNLRISTAPAAAAVKPGQSQAH
jgi:hypothetical protein